MTLESVEVDYLVIGSGLAGLTYALQMAPYGKVALLTKKTRTDANSSWAQGGIAGAIADDDSFELHKQDTLIAGAGLCNEAAVEILVHEGPERIRELITMGAQFNREKDAEGQDVLSLGREGGHSRNRIVHTADYTGWECERTLLEAVKSHPEIDVYEHYFVTDLTLSGSGEDARCAGAFALHGETGEHILFLAKATLLATGGCGQVYQHTTNPMVATGDGVAIAWRAGADISNMEFIQFHPTTLYHPKARAFLITEALRGEGGILCHADGEQFMKNYHPSGELAPRDIVARAIVSEMNRKKVSCVYLDVTHIDPELLKSHFPTVYERCLSVGIDISKEPIPIAPAQHYQCGGVVTDLNGATRIKQLYAAGEVASTGVHGANRLASNSLLEAMVFGYRAAKCSIDPNLDSEAHNVASDPVQKQPDYVLKSSEQETGGEGDAPKVSDLKTLHDIKIRSQKVMQRYAGIVRNTADLTAALKEIERLTLELANYPANLVDVWEIKNSLQVGALILQSALARHESRGLHFTTDYPQSADSQKHDTILRKQTR